MKHNFIQPRFDGGERFREHTLPLEVAGDLIAYEELVKELAKKLYLDEHPKRKRAPRGFGSEFSLQLADVEEGSARPLLALVAAANLSSPLAAVSLPYLKSARDLVTECVAAPDGQLPPQFPKELLKYFNQIGRSLEEGEVMELPVPSSLSTASDGNAVKLTPQRRKTLVLEAQKLYQKEFEYAGIVSNVHFEKSLLDLRTEEGPLLHSFPYEEELEVLLREHAGKKRSLFTLEGVGSFDSHDSLRKVLRVHAIKIQKNFQLSRRLEEIASWQDGWLDGIGNVPETEALEAFAGDLIESYPDDLPLPGITLTAEGELVMEWHSPAEAIVDIDLATNIGEFQAFEDELEESIDFNSEQGWRAFYSLLNRTIS